jgi:lactam utilization protein B
MRKTREGLQKLHAAKIQSPVGSPEYKEAEAALRKGAEAMKNSTTADRARFLKSESQIYHDHYTRIYDLIGDHAKQEGFKAVFRSPDGKGKPVQQSVNPRSIDPVESRKILATLNQNLLFVDGDNPDSVDITAAIIARLNGPQKETADVKRLAR